MKPPNENHHADRARDQPGTALARLWAAALPLAGRLLRQLRSESDLPHNEVVRVDCERWHDGCVALVGDAAHAMAPSTGQGANSALVDGAVLTAELVGKGSHAMARERYTSRRRAATSAAQDRADELTRLSALRHPPPGSPGMSACG